jgi:UDP-N-acetylmuramoylalanine--D-glutamate ligase
MTYELVILGSGESGVGAALLAQQQGIAVFVSDGGALKAQFKIELQQANIPFEENGHTEAIVLSAKEIIKSPGIPHKADIIKKAIAKNISIISEIEFGYRYKGDSKIVAITGTNGKTTTTNLTYYIFEQAGYSVSMCGNIGISFARQIACHPTEWYIIEISSFQLDDIKTFKPNIAVLLNITPDHLDRYDYNISNYIASKFKIAMNQTHEDFFIVCADDKTITDNINNNTILSNTLYFTMQDKPKQPMAGFTDSEQLVIDINGELLNMNTSDIQLQGKHNLHNSMASGISARVAEIRKEKIRDSLSTFKALEHRLEPVAFVRGIEFINDSKATNINSVWYALESMKKPTVLIMGGVDKGNDYTEIEHLIKEKVKAIVCLGLDNKAIHDAFSKYDIEIVDANNAKDAVIMAYNLSEKGDAVLLSPACASFDLFANYEDRGAKFKQAVKEL